VEIWCLQKVIIQGNPRVYIEIELNFWQFVRNYRWWTVARRSVPNVSIMSSFSCGNLNHYPFAHPDAILPPTGLFRCHSSTHYSIPMPPFYPLLHPDGKLPPTGLFRLPPFYPVVHPDATLLPSGPSRCHMHLSICIVLGIVCKLVMNKMLRFKSHAIIKFYYCNQVTQIHGECRILMK
jgi:hypothetical protein